MALIRENRTLKQRDLRVDGTYPGEWNPQAGDIPDLMALIRENRTLKQRNLRVDGTYPGEWNPQAEKSQS